MTTSLEFFHRIERRMVQWLVELTNTDSPSGDVPALDQLAHRFAQHFDYCGAQTEIVQNTDCGKHLMARWRAGQDGTQQVLILGHLDTVWPAGECQLRPARIEGGKLFGPGSFDMRGGLTLVKALAEYLSEQRHRAMRPVTVLLTSDEEVGSPTSRGLIENEAQKSQFVLVVEPCLPGGALKTQRKGVGRFTVEVHGVAAHAGVDFTKGISAIEEIAHQILRLSAFNDPSQGTTVNVGVVRGGSRPNVVADHAVIEVDLRVCSAAEGDRLTAEILHLKPKVSGARLNVSGGMNRPPLERTDNIARAFLRAKALASEIGIALEEGQTGGGSDGCFTAALGIPTLDGLGPDGAGPHALHEHVLLESLVPRAALLTRLALEF